MTLIHTKTKGGTPVWNLAGNTKPFSSWLGKGGAGGTWYGPKKVWSFYGEEDPTEKILKALPPKPVQGETQEQFVDRIVGGIAEKAKDVPRDELKTTILRNLPPSISIAEGEKWIESNLLKTEITQSKPESLMDKAKKVGVAISKDYKKGDRVTWKDRNGKELSGTVQRDPFADDVYISVDTDQIAHAGGVPIGRIEMVWLTNPSLKKIESQSAQEPEEPSQKTPEVVKSTQQEPGIKEAVTNDNAGEDKPRDVRQNGVGTPGETPPEMVRELRQKGNLLEVLQGMEQSFKEAILQQEEQLENQNPLPEKATYLERVQHQNWIRQTAWEMLKDQLLLPDEEIVPNLSEITE
jgi:hypothetical protein